jgi:hypothetical protein
MKEKVMMPSLTDVSCVLSLVFCGIIINQLLSKVNNIRFFYLTMVFTVLHETFLIETIPNLEEFGFIQGKIVSKIFKLNFQILL